MTSNASQMSPGESGDNWIISPTFDLAFFANLWWVLGLIPAFYLADQTTPFDFWQLYFLTTPHRWLTLFLVTTDPDRREGRTWLFVMLAAIAGCIVLGTRGLYGAFTCLAVVDYVWNAWHFASQHAGITRIYARKSGGGRPWMESILIRTFVTYTCLRLAGWTTGWTESVETVAQLIRLIDFGMLGLPILLLSLDALTRPRTCLSKLVYMGSFSAMYAGLIIGVNGGYHGLLIGLTVASAAFHAVEYMAVVTFYAWRRREHGSRSPFQLISRHWIPLLGTFILCLGVIAYHADTHWKQMWFGLNLWAAFLHYAYDGMIWKLRRPETAKTLNVQLSES